MNQKTKKLILLIELEDGAVHQAILSTTQEAAIKAVLKSLPDTVQLVSTPLNLTIKENDGL